VSWFKAPFPTGTMRNGKVEFWSEGTVCHPVHLKLFCSRTFPGGGGKTILRLNGGYNILSGKTTCGA